MSFLSLHTPGSLEATRITDLLYQGSRPPTGKAVADAGFDVLVLSAIEYQPNERRFPGVEVISVPLQDTYPSHREIALAHAASEKVARRLRAGRRVLSTCYAGLNRSGWISALALKRLGMRPDHTVALIRHCRGKNALSNPSFVEDVLG